jgi:hypothetical protein
VPSDSLQISRRACCYLAVLDQTAKSLRAWGTKKPQALLFSLGTGPESCCLELSAKVNVRGLSAPRAEGATTGRPAPAVLRNRHLGRQFASDREEGRSLFDRIKRTPPPRLRTNDTQNPGCSLTLLSGWFTNQIGQSSSGAVQWTKDPLLGQ